MAIAQLIIAAAFIGVCTIGCVEETKLPQANSRDFALDRCDLQSWNISGGRTENDCSSDHENGQRPTLPCRHHRHHPP